MRNWPLFAVAGCLLAGCMEPQLPEDPFPNIEARVEGGGLETEWSTERVNVTLVSTRMIPKSAPTPGGGGGGEYNLSLPATDAKLHLRLANADRFADAKALWVFRDTSGPAVVVREVRQPATEELVVRLTRATQFLASVDLFWDAAPQGHYNDLLWISIQGRIIVDSSIHPVSAAKAPRPPNHQAMSDKFTLNLPPDEPSMLTAMTAFRGPWPGPHGTNLDLTVIETSPKPAGWPAFPPSCSPRVPPQPQPATPNEATEVAGHSVATNILVQVGLLHPTCPRADEYAYANPAPVPYRLVIDAVFQHPS